MAVQRVPRSATDRRFLPLRAGRFGPHAVRPEGNTEDTVLFVRVCGANLDFDDAGQLHSILDTLTIRVLADTLSAAQGLPAPRYIEGAETDFSEPSVATTAHDADNDARQISDPSEPCLAKRK